MKEEIKEILDYWKFYINEPNNYKLLNVHFDEIKRVLDCITNLQQENKRLNNIIEELEKYINKRMEEHNGDYDYDGNYREDENILDKLKKLKGE